MNYMDLVEGTSLTETMDDSTGISSKSVTDWKSLSKNTELKPRLTLRNDKVNLRQGPSFEYPVISESLSVVTNPLINLYSRINEVLDWS